MLNHVIIQLLNDWFNFIHKINRLLGRLRLTLNILCPEEFNTQVLALWIKHEEFRCGHLEFFTRNFFNSF